MLSLASCASKISSIESGFYLLGATKDELIMEKGVPDKMYQSDGLEVCEYFEVVASLYKSSDVNHGSSLSRQFSSRYVLKNNKIISFVTPLGSGRIN